MVGQEVTLEDLNSTNGTYVNGKAVKKQLLQSGDTIEVGKYKIRFIAELESSEYDKTMVVKPRSRLPTPWPRCRRHGATSLAAGRRSPGRFDQGAVGLGGWREVSLTKVVTTIGKPGVAVAAITRRPHGFVLAHVEGGTFPTLNGNAVRPSHPQER
jgi:pSer/pThr/pTyr-binding forkhead associated (FHA) protein